jgi:Fe-S cluster assembly protein SufD
MNRAAVIAASEHNREAWKYTSLKALKAFDFVPAVGHTKIDADALPGLMPATDRHRLVFVDGQLRHDLSAMQDLPSDLLTGDATTGYVLMVGGQTCLITAPLELVFVATKSAVAQESRVTLRLELGANARLTLIEHHISQGVGTAHVALCDATILLQEQAKLLHAKFQQLDTDDYHLAQTKISVAKGAYYDHFAMTTGAALSRHDIAVTLVGAEAQAQLHGVYLQRRAQHTDTTMIVDHAAPNTSSRTVYKGVLDDRACGVFQGKILVRPNAQKTDGQQMTRALLLSGQAEADSKPELEIYADDVKCGHGATVGQLDETALFYLRSRGVPLDAARALLIAAFAGEVIEQLTMPALRAYAAELAQRWHGESA